MLNRYAMLWLVLCTIHGLLVLITPANGQSAIHKDDMLEIHGVQFRLGMDQNQVFKRLREERIGVLRIEQFSSSKKTAWRLCETLEDTECNLGQVTFMNGRLELVLKRWIETKSAARVVTAFYGAARDFEKHGFNQCQLAPQENLLPDQEVQTVKLVCTEHLWLHISLVRPAKEPISVVVDQVLSGGSEHP